MARVGKPDDRKQLQLSPAFIITVTLSRLFPVSSKILFFHKILTGVHVFVNTETNNLAFSSLHNLKQLL